MLNITKMLYAKSRIGYTANRLQFIKNLYNTYGNDKYTIGESMTQKQHAIYTFKYLKDRQERDNLCVSGFLHDIGHPFSNLIKDTPEHPGNDECGVFRHHEIGAILLARIGFNDEIVNLINLHVDAKRYQKSTDHTMEFSSASEHTFLQQGSYMTKEEILVFSKHPLFKQTLQLREADDKSKFKFLKDITTIDNEDEICEDEIFEDALRTISRVLNC